MTNWHGEALLKIAMFSLNIVYTVYDQLLLRFFFSIARVIKSLNAFADILKILENTPR